MPAIPHVVTAALEPFTSADGRLEVHRLPAWQDNLVWVLRCTETDTVAVVDGPEAGGVLDWCEARGLTLGVVLNTHTHPDHIGINKDLKRRGKLDGVTVYGPANKAAAVPGLTDPVDEGATVRVGAVTGRVWLTEGHLDGHVSYLFDDLLFCGDTLFTSGCGYLFDGPPATMHASLARLRGLPDSTQVCCAHEYTQDGLRFAWTVDEGNDALAERIRDTWRVRAEGGTVVPSTLGLERATNPFLRFDDPAVRARVAAAWPDRALTTDADVFAATRALKDRKDYKALGDTHLPL